MAEEIVDEDSDDWDSEPELEIAQVQEAARLSRRIPSIRRQKSSITNKMNNASQPTQIAQQQQHQQQQPPRITDGSPYYCQVVGPQLDLGYQWPQPKDLLSQKSHGFVTVSPGNNSSRQRNIDRRLLTRRQRVRNWRALSLGSHY